MKVYDLVILGVTPADEADEKEKEAYRTLFDQAAVIYIQVVSPEILEIIVKHDHPHHM